MAKKSIWAVHFLDNPFCREVEAKTPQEVANILIKEGITPAGLVVQRISK